jgi:hypothetical protein
MALTSLTHESRLRALSDFGESCRVGCINPICDPYIDGRTEDVRSPALLAATADLLAAADRLGAQAKLDLTTWLSAERAETLNRERHERAEKGKS